jgi:aminoglycoside phosphotransferase (APT) family kinase protein
MLSQQIAVKAVNVLRYRPGRRCVLHYQAERDGRPFDIVGKLYRKPKRAFETAKTHDALSRWQSDVLKVPALLAEPYDGFLLMEYVSGRNLGDALEHESSSSEREHFIRSAARALAALHSMALVSRERRTVAAEFVSLQERLAALRQAASDLHHELEGFTQKIASHLAKVDAPGSCTIHGEYKPNQLLVSDGDIALVDLDRVCNGDPAIDVGNFAAVLCKEVALERHAHLEDLARVFLDEYLEQRSSPGVAERARLYKAIALLRMLVRSFERAPQQALQQGDVWQPLVLLREAQRALDSL